MSEEIFLERMTSPAVRAAIDEGRTTAVVACGAVEQHGPHLPLFMDAEHGVWLAEEVARRLGNALVAPTIRVGCSEHHMRFAGSMSLRVDTFKALCYDYCVSLSRQGGYRGDLTPEVLERVFRDGIGAVTPNGILGDARGMSESLGRRCLNETARLLVERFRSAMAAEPAVGGR